MLNHDRLAKILDELEDCCYRAEKTLMSDKLTTEDLVTGNKSDERDMYLLVCLRAIYMLYEDWLHTRPFN